MHATKDNYNCKILLARFIVKLYYILYILRATGLSR